MKVYQRIAYLAANYERNSEEKLNNLLRQFHHTLSISNNSSHDFLLFSFSNNYYKTGYDVMNQGLVRYDVVVTPSFIHEIEITAKRYLFDTASNTDPAVLSFVEWLKSESKDE